MIQHTNRLLAEIKSIPALASKMWVSRIPAGTPAPVPPYGILHPADGTDTTDRITGPKVTQHPRFILHIVGSTYDQCASVAALVKNKLIVNGFGIVLDVPGEWSGRVWYSSPVPIQVDEDVSPPLIWHTSEIGFSSTPMPA